MWVQSLSWEDPLEEGMAYIHHIYTWASLVVQMLKNPPSMQETRVQSLGWKDPWEKGMATHSSVIARRTAWTEEPGWLQSESHRIDGLSDLAHMHAYIYTYTYTYHWGCYFLLEILNFLYKNLDCLVKRGITRWICVFNFFYILLNPK